MGTVFRGIGVDYPETRLTNAELEKRVDTTDEWITTRTGIKERRILSADSPLKASDFGAAAAQRALTVAGISALDIDAIIVGNVWPDKQFPATACFIQEKIGAKKAFAFDVTAACAGFVFGVNLADLYIQSGQCNNVLVIGTEILSRVVDWTDRNTCVLFGDAAGAAVLSRGPTDQGIISSRLKSDGAYSEILYLDTLVNADLATESAPHAPRMRMDGKQVFKLAVTEVSALIAETVAGAGFNLADLDLLVMHQANVRILGAIADKLGVPMEKVIVNVDHFGNTSSASIPLALHEAQQDGRLKRGMLVALAGVGGGMSWGCNLVRW